MLKVYGIEADVFEHATYEEIVREVTKTGFVQVDTETTGFDPHTCELLCFQLGNYDNQYVIHPSKLQEFKGLLEKEHLIFHNAKFDLKFLYKQDIWPRKVYDTLLAEAVLFCGIKEHRKALNAVAKRRLGVSLDKSIRDNIWKEGLTRRVVEYAADDVKYLEAIMTDQKHDLYQKDLHIALELENRFVKALAYIEFCGFKLDVPRWKAKCDNDLELFRKAEEEVNQYIIENNIDKFISKQLDLFSTERKVTINWASPKQVIELFKILKIPTSFIEEGEEKDSVSAKVIERYAKQFPFIEKYLKFKEYQKLVSTYGYNFIRQINPVTGRLHTNFTQVMDTSRLSSGGKNRATKESYLNFQNIPSDKETRACFIAEKGNTLLVSDYSGQEQIVLANFSMDSGLLEFYDKGLADMHSFVASKMHPELEGLTLDEIKDNHKDKRQKAKIAGFAINYGGNGSTIADQLSVTKEEGDAVFNGYFEAFPGLKDHFEKSKKQGLRDGYILFNEITYRKSYIGKFEEYLELKQEINKEFWEKWKKVKEREPDDPVRLRMREKIKTFFKIKGGIERKSLNYPIQGSSAEITKISCVYFFDWIIKNRHQNVVLMVNTVHDENVVECPEHLADVTAERLQDAMVRAGEIYCKRVPLKAEPEKTRYWKK